MTGLIMAALVFAANPGTAQPAAIVLDVGLVRVSPTRPGTDKPWDTPDERPPKDPCSGIGTLASFVPGVGPVVGAVCKIAELGETGRTQKHSPTDPDLFVRIVGGPRSSFRSYTVRNSVSHVFHFRVTVPASVDTQIRPYVDT